MNQQATPKFSPGDAVKIISPDDPDYGKTVTIISLSPSTKKRRSHGQWRYRLSNQAYLCENQLEKLAR